MDKETAKDHDIPIPSIQASFDVRFSISAKAETNFATKLVAAMQQVVAHDINGKQ